MLRSSTTHPILPTKEPAEVTWEELKRGCAMLAVAAVAVSEWYAETYGALPEAVGEFVRHEIDYAVNERVALLKPGLLLPLKG